MGSDNYREKKVHKTGDERHKLSEININSRKALCSVCGPTTLYIKGNRPRCATKSMCEQMSLGYYIGMVDIEKLIGFKPPICTICQKTNNRRIVVDHDHNTDEIRGWLCDKCNMGLGYLSDDEDTILRLAEYVRKYKIRKEKS